MNSATEMAAINKSNLCSSSETVPLFHPLFSSPFWDFHKMHQDTELTFNQEFKLLLRLNMEIQYKLLFVYHTKKVKDLCIYSWRVLHREQHFSCSWHPSRPSAVANSSTITTSQDFKLFLKTHPCEIKITSHERANHKCLVHLSSTVCSH